ncbi:hypothetical protein GEMRC1_002252 [Eukaryota sp. GEM-RC1]
MWYGVTSPVCSVVFAPVLFNFPDTQNVAVFAVATRFTEIIICRVDQPKPILIMEKLTYVSDLSWSTNGMALSFCSSVGHVGVIAFDDVEFWPIPQTSEDLAFSVDVEVFPKIVTFSNGAQGQSSSSGQVNSLSLSSIKSKRNGKIKILSQSDVQKGSPERSNVLLQRMEVPKPRNLINSTISSLQSQRLLSFEVGDYCVTAESVDTSHTLLKSVQKSQNQKMWKYLLPGSPVLLRCNDNFIVLALDDGTLNIFKFSSGCRVFIPILQTSGVNYISFFEIFQVFAVTSDLRLFHLDLNNLKIVQNVEISSLLSTRPSASVVSVTFQNENYIVSLSNFEKFVYCSDVKYWSKMSDNFHVFSNFFSQSEDDLRIDSLLKIRQAATETLKFSKYSAEFEILDSLDYCFLQIFSNFSTGDKETAFLWFQQLLKFAVMSENLKLFQDLLDFYVNYTTFDNFHQKIPEVCKFLQENVELLPPFQELLNQFQSIEDVFEWKIVFFL